MSRISHQDILSALDNCDLRTAYDMMVMMGYNWGHAVESLYEADKISLVDELELMFEN